MRNVRTLMYVRRYVYITLCTHEKISPLNIDNKRLERVTPKRAVPHKNHFAKQEYYIIFDVRIKHIHYAFWMRGLHHANSFAGYYRAVKLKPFAQFPSGKHRVIWEWENHSWMFYIRRSFPRSSASPLMDRNIPAANEIPYCILRLMREIFRQDRIVNRPHHLDMSWCVFDWSWNLLTILRNRSICFDLVMQIYQNIYSKFEVLNGSFLPMFLCLQQFDFTTTNLIEIWIKRFSLPEEC